MKREKQSEEQKAEEIRIANGVINIIGHIENQITPQLAVTHIALCTVLEELFDMPKEVLDSIIHKLRKLEDIGEVIKNVHDALPVIISSHLEACMAAREKKLI